MAKADVIKDTFGPGDDGTARPEPKARAATVLGRIEDDDVLAARIIIRGAGDGLSDALDIDPVIYKRGETVFVLLELEVKEVRFPAIKKIAKAVARAHDCKAVVGTIVDGAVAEQMLVEQKRLIAEAKAAEELAAEAAKGIQRIEGTEDA